ncbi:MULTISPECIES: hypothetical protein [unclassified Thioalkalivibrio]|uniref:hypothetical protein n=1 Tax=unclassified Thioalkalivibrio TaxID=2621013 RepID=UPI000362374A|nr:MULTISPECIES: hypothetical protein [unclassified Thioalkalivibrio]
MQDNYSDRKRLEGIRKSARAMRRSLGSMTEEQAARAGRIVPLEGWNGLDLIELDELFEALEPAPTLRAIWRARTEFGIHVTGPVQALEQIREYRLDDLQRFQLVTIAKIEWARMRNRSPRGSASASTLSR